MKRPRKTLAEKIESRLKVAADAKKAIGVLKATESAKQTKANKRRMMILGRTCLKFFKEALPEQRPEGLEKILVKWMKPTDLIWYKANPHGLVFTKLETPPPNVAGDGHGATDENQPTPPENQGGAS